MVGLVGVDPTALAMSMPRSPAELKTRSWGDVATFKRFLTRTPEVVPAEDFETPTFSV
jgi:hypothetical protein